MNVVRLVLGCLAATLCFFNSLCFKEHSFLSLRVISDRIGESPVCDFS